METARAEGKVEEKDLSARKTKLFQKNTSLERERTNRRWQKRNISATGDSYSFMQIGTLGSLIRTIVFAITIRTEHGACETHIIKRLFIENTNSPLGSMQ